MGERPVDWCPKCEQRTQMEVAIAAGSCFWCDTPLVYRRRGGKPTGKWGKLTDEQLRAAHVLHIQGGISVRELSRRLYEGAGFRSEKSCAMGICTGWRRLGGGAVSCGRATVRASRGPGLTARDRIDAARAD